MIPWDEVRAREGTGIVHIAPGCGAEDFDSARDGLPVLPRSTSPARSGAVRLAHGQTRRPTPPISRTSERGLLFARGEFTHRYPVCWRCGPS